MKTIIFVVAGLAVGTLGGTAFGGLKGKSVLVAQLEAEKAAEAEASMAEEGSGTEAHGTEADEAQSDSKDSSSSHGEALNPEEPTEAHPGATPETASEGSPDQTNPLAADAGTKFTEEALGIPTDNPTQVGEESNPPPDPGQQTPPGPAEADTAQQTGGGTLRLARIFGAMKAPDAAKVLQNLDDDEVSAILFHLSDRKAAEILGNFAPERAATLSRAVLGSPGGEES